MLYLCEEKSNAIVKKITYRCVLGVNLMFILKHGAVSKSADKEDGVQGRAELLRPKDENEGWL
jgi:hypothetical protein